MMRIEWGAATARDIDEFYGERPHETLRAIVICLDGVPVGIIGLAIGKHSARAFSESKPALEPFLKSMPVLRAIKASQKLFTASRKPVIAMREGCSGILERIGFVQIDDEVYRWPS